jgi:SAM-dependent methyltransferase
MGLPRVSDDVQCRSCGSSRVRPFLSLGKTPLADGLVPAERLDAPEARYPLDAAFCEDCTLVQILEEVPADVLFGSDYPYFSSFSDHLLKHSAEHANGLIAARGLDASSLVVELASNDGYLLRNFVEAGVPCLGVEPTPGPAAAARELGVETVERFFGSELATELRAERGAADVIIANNVMAHVPELNDFVAGLAILVADDGVITVENPYVRDLIDHCEFDTIYHEHFCYYSCTSVSNLVSRHGLHLNDVEYFPDLHGGTLRWHLGRSLNRTERAAKYLQDEQDQGLVGFDYYGAFADRVSQLKRDLRELITGLRASGASIAAYGAAAKGSTLINYCELGTDLLDFVVDRNVHKQGWFMPGVHLPILEPQALLERKPDYTLILAWNFAEEIMRQQSDYLSAGGRFIVPVPTPRIAS